jgi:hypothetical protein
MRMTGQRLCLAGCVAALVLAIPRAQEQVPPAAARTGMNAIAERYVKLVLALGLHDRDYVDAYYGPPEWRREVEAAHATLDDIAGRAGALLQSLRAVPEPTQDLDRLRVTYLERQLSALGARVRMLKGERLSFDEESRALYDAVAPEHTESHFQAILD